jgi:hypothetical protein
MTEPELQMYWMLHVQQEAVTPVGRRWLMPLELVFS